MNKHRKLDEIFDQCIRTAKKQIIEKGTISPNPIVFVLSKTPQGFETTIFVLASQGQTFNEFCLIKKVFAKSIKEYIQNTKSFGYIMIGDCYTTTYKGSEMNKRPANLKDDPKAKECIIAVMKTLEYSRMKQIIYEHKGEKIILKQEINVPNPTEMQGRFFEMLPSFN